MNFYRRFPGDYLRDTQHLTHVEHAIYTLLLDTLYATERPIRSREEAFRIARCSEHDGSIAQAVLVIEEFFIESVDGIWHSKVEKEIKYAESRRLKASTAAQVKWSKHAPSNATSNAPAMRVPDSRLQTIQTPEKANTQTPLVPEENAFQTFWKAYPKKVNERQAFRAWVQCIGIHNHLEEILTVLMKYETSGMWDDPTKIPNAENFIRDKRWNDVVPQRSASVRRSEPSKSEEQRQRVKRAIKRVLGVDSQLGDHLHGELRERSDGGNNPGVEARTLTVATKTPA